AAPSAVGEKRQKRATLDLGPGRAAGKLDEGGSDVLADDQVLEARARLHERRKAQNERSADARLVGEPALGSQAMLAEEVAVVAQEENRRIGQPGAPREPPRGPADPFPHRRRPRM